MKDIKLNKKGFTLVELLAVIVILALLIVITANTILPMMAKSRRNAMLVYAERVLSNASSSFQADSISQGNNTPQNYSIVDDLMGSSQDEYIGCVQVTYNVSTKDYTYIINIYDLANSLKLEGKASSTALKADADKVVRSETITTTRSDYTDEECDTYVFLGTSYNLDKKDGK